MSSMRDRLSIGWLVKFALTGSLVLLICATVKPLLSTGMHAPATTARDGSLVALNRYISEPASEVILLGSSLTARIREDYFASVNVRNLAIGGGSPLTGLRILLNRKQLPKTILIETNLMSKEADEKLVERYSNPSSDLFFRPVRMAAAVYENWMHAPPPRIDAIVAANRLLTESPRQYDNEVYIARVFQGMSQVAALSVERNVEQLAQLVAEARELGVRILMFELPYANPITNARLVQDTRRLVSARFANENDWLRLDIPIDELRWPDGLHMDERSAMLTARTIEYALGESGARFSYRLPRAAGRSSRSS
ncbi:hypothetical protein [Bradyrhizobium ottawaense]|uniref:hypothetical protein n=1 Tax=Bradyrhizobium ottawaense TaxID=931866 RepID=UPI001BA43F3F|nr:hypothetical protein [Bradyrhizobium ottawaense]MBR1363439.1 hypothetical protein [Bradyrhizobium ottawaense]